MELRSLREQAVACEFSVGWTITGREHTAIALLAERDWNAAIDVDGHPRPAEEAAVAEITDLLAPAALAGYPPGTRVIVRREHPHPGAQLDAIEERVGRRAAAGDPGRVAGIDRRGSAV